MKLRNLVEWGEKRNEVCGGAGEGGGGEAIKVS